MAGLDPAIHVVGQRILLPVSNSGGRTWMPGSSPGMTEFI